MRRYFAVYGNELIRAGEVKQLSWKSFILMALLSPFLFFHFDYRAVNVLSCVSCMKDAYIQLRTRDSVSASVIDLFSHFISLQC